MLNFRTTLVVLFCLAGYSLSGQVSDFSGTWVLNREKSDLQSEKGLSNPITNSIFIIRQSGDKFFLTRYHFYGEKRKRIKFKMTADGKIRRVKLLFKSRLEVIDNKNLKASLWNKSFSDNVSYTLQNDGQELIADEVYTSYKTNYHNLWVFQREKSE